MGTRKIQTGLDVGRRFFAPHFAHMLKVALCKALDVVVTSSDGNVCYVLTS